MDFDLSQFDPATTAWVFPGQGAHGPSMLDYFRDVLGFDLDYARLCDRLGYDPLASSRPLCGNAESSLLTVLASVLALRKIRAQHPHFLPMAFAGYSVGQWTALYAAGIIPVEQLFDLVFRRAELMDACLAEWQPSGMLAVIGVREADVREVCTIITQRGFLLEITNENAPGQFTLGGTLAALNEAETLFALKHPKRMIRLPVAGAWHSSWMQPAVVGIKSMLSQETFLPASCPIIDNTTGGWLPTVPAELVDALARQVAAPVKWSDGIRTLEAHGVRHVIEVGYGDVLTKFGFFISRAVRHVALVPSVRNPHKDGKAPAEP